MNLVAVVLNWNGGDDTLAALESLVGVDTVCVDNGSDDGSPDAVAARFPSVELIRTGVNLGFSGGNNVGIRRALARGADWVLLLNNDAVADPGLPAALAAAAAERPDAGVLACKVFFADPPDVLMYAGGRVNLRLGYWGRQDGFGQRDDGRFDTLRDVDRATGAAMAVSRAAIERAGLLDESLFAYAEDTEWCLRIREAGFGVVFVPDAKVWHVGSASTGGMRSPTSIYYDTRNMIAVAERHDPRSGPAAAVRRGVVLGAHLANARDAAGVRAAVKGWRDARRGRLGRR
ncbi:MAG TPA: glycosyltransferase family 2 protein [Gaiellaceae bacterium]|nr:glycosyltransferase family 2 protein [Gaiellaceae bacterium]